MKKPIKHAKIATMNSEPTKEHRAFSLVGIMVVLAIIGLLAAWFFTRGIPSPAQPSANVERDTATTPAPNLLPQGSPVCQGATFSALPVVAVYLEKPSVAAERWAFLFTVLGKGDHASFRLFGPEDELLIREHWDTALKSPDTVLGELEKAPMESSSSSTEERETTRLEAEVEKPGFYVARLVSGQRKTRLEVQASGASAYGVSFQNGLFQPWKSGLQEAWFFIPSNAVELRLSGKGVRVYDDEGKQQFPIADDAGQEAKLAIGRREVLWRVVFDEPAWEFRAAGFPVILGEDQEFLRRLGAGLIRTPSGALVPHHFQTRAEGAIRELLAPEKVGDSEALLALMNAEPEDWDAQDLAEVNALRGPYGLYPHLKFALEEQLLEPDNHWAGTIGREIWQDRLASDSPETRWDYLRRNPLRAGQGHGGLSSHAYAASLAQAYALDRPFNALHGRPELLHRAAAAALRDLMSVNEEGILAGSASEMSDYSGFPSFVFGQRHFQEFAIAAPHMPPHIREIWTEGLRHLVDRYWPEGLVSTRNQSSHFLTAFQYFAMGSDDPVDQALAKKFAARFIAGMSDAGYPAEAGGPCASYVGISHHYMSKYWLHSGDDDMRAALEKSYDFFNHTAAPEPDGGALAGFNFNHRVPAGFHAEQYSGARSLAWKGLENVRPWKRDKDRSRTASVSGAEHWSPQPVATQARFPQLAYFATAVGGEDSLPGQWPSESKEPFIKVFGDELVAVKRPGYYAAFYVGRPAATPYYLFGAAKGIKPWPDGGESNSGSMQKLYVEAKGTRRPFNNGGLTIFQTPEFGSAILGAPAPFTHHGLVAKGENGLLHAEDYFAAEFQLNEQENELKCTGRLDTFPLQYQRSYQFNDDHLAVRLQCSASADFKTEDLIECIPLLGGPAKASGANLEIVSGDNGRARAALLRDRNGQGIRIEFSEPVEIRTCQTGPVSPGGIQHNRIEIVLPREWKKGQISSLEYRIVPVSAATSNKSSETPPTPAADAIEIP